MQEMQAGDLGLIPGLGRSSGEGNGNPLQYSCLENPMNRGAWQATVHRVLLSWTQPSNGTHTHKQSKHCKAMGTRYLFPGKMDRIKEN